MRMIARGLPLIVYGLQVHLPLFHHVRGPAIDYFGVALAAFVSWVGVPGPGEPVLIAAAIVASKHSLDITPLVFWAWIGAVAGGTVGWLIGLKAGHRILIAPGPLMGVRRRAVERGEEVFRRVEVLAILFTPSWVAGINRSRARVYLPVNAISALLLWALPIAVGAYYLGPVILDLLADVGTIATIILLIVIAVLVVTALRRRRRERALRRDQAAGTTSS
jgi:membrane protein DedA with SNARE-associated domain